MRKSRSKPGLADFVNRVTAPLARTILELMDDLPEKRPTASALASRLRRILDNISA